MSQDGFFFCSVLLSGAIPTLAPAPRSFRNRRDRTRASLKRYLHDSKAIYCISEKTDLIPESWLVATASEDNRCGSTFS